ncbi:polysaccharide pyruvyl transferase family protein [Rhodoplanes elegans]|uniref:polysaccharide pyruvyl transferase family protein n=2 Tax=Rhodoplanes elegans TaxID=29408 RepID=UPI001913107A|nr:polysaccharide pyruvyl transferase family protein [Rhodoplanes elegans]
MILHYYKSVAGNFGDDLNLWLWPRLLPDAWTPDDGIRFAGIGSIITATMPSAPGWIVLGSGAGYGPAPRGFGGPGWCVLSVRGPLSARVLELPADKAITDGALLLSTLSEYRPLPEAERAGCVFVPHHQALDAGNWPEVCRRAGIEFLDPRGDSRDVVARLRRARLVIADSMHAAIIADTMRVPWIPVVTSLEINTFKWLDWCGSMEVPYRPIELPASTLDEWVRSMALPIHGQRYHVSPPTETKVLSHYRRSVAIKQRAWWPLAQRCGERIYFSGVRRVLRAAHFSGLTRSAREARIDVAAAALRRAAETPSWLSDDRVWRNRTDRLCDQVERLRSHSRSGDLEALM